ncbi:MAG: SOS response-associated peptidase [Algisphaera sp.]
MCGRYTLSSTTQLARHFNLCEPARAADLPPRFNIAPTQPVPVVFRERGRSQLLMMRWGLVPAWKKPDEGNKLPAGWFNARAETLNEKPAFRGAYRYRRCLIPADGFYEWQNTGRAKQPHLIRTADEGLFAFAGVFEWWSSPDGSELPTVTVVTTTANTLMAPLHDRMPVILEPEDYRRWTDMREGNDPRDLLRPLASERMITFPVSPRVGNVRHDDALCMARFKEEATKPESQGSLFD